MADTELVDEHRPTRPGRIFLMRTAIELMGERGYEGTSTRDIASAAGVSVAALYYHFPSKLDLLREFLFEAHDVVLNRLERELGAFDGSPAERLDLAVAVLVSAHIHDRWAQLATNVAWREHGRLAEADRQLIADKRNQLIDIIEAIIDDGIATGDFATVESRDVARAVVTLSISVVDPLPLENRSMEDWIDLVQRFARALASTPLPAPKRRRRAASVGAGRRRPSPATN